MKYLCLTNETKLSDAIKLLDENGHGFLPIVNTANQLVGIITDGDLRRAILNNKLNLNEVINVHPLTASDKTPLIEIKQRLKQLRRRHMPVVDENGVLLNVVVLDEFETERKHNWVVIMAGGIGSRLGELTQNIPKPMLPVNGKPILANIIEDFKQQGFYRFILCVNHLGEMIEDYFGDGSKWGITIIYTREKQRLGTAGALSLIDIKMEEPFIVTNADLLLNLDLDGLINFHSLNNAFATMCVKLYSHEVPFACIDFDETHSLVRLREKPSFDFFVNAGMYVLQPEALKEVPKNVFYDMPSLFEKFIQLGKPTKVFQFNDFWLDIGRPEDYRKANNLLKNNR